MELSVTAYTLKTSSASSGSSPTFRTAKQCKMRRRGSIVCKLLASMLTEAGTSWVCLSELQLTVSVTRRSRRFPRHPGLTHVITVDLHQKEIQGFNLRASPFLIQHIQEEVRPRTRTTGSLATRFASREDVFPFTTSRNACAEVALNSLARPLDFSQIPDYRNVVIVAKSPSAARR